MDKKYDPANLFLKEFGYSKWYEEPDDESWNRRTKWWRRVCWYRIHAMIRGWQRRSKIRKRLKMLTPNKLFTRLLVLLAQIKAGNNPNKLKNEIWQILYLLYQHNKIAKELYNNLIKSL